VPDPRINARACARRIVRVLAPGQIVLIAGPSGSGKSTTLNELSRIAQTVALRIVRPRPPQPDLPAISQLGRDFDDAMSLLARAGLSDAGTIVRPAGELSEGERARLSLAIALGRARSHDTLLVADEFTSALDATTARSVAISLARWIRLSPVRAALAGTRESLIHWLSPDLVLQHDLARDALLVARDQGGTHATSNTPSPDATRADMDLPHRARVA